MNAYADLKIASLESEPANPCRAPGIACLVKEEKPTAKYKRLKFSDKLLRNLDWNLVRTFVSIVSNRSLTRAGEELYRTQPAISAALKRLEDSLGVVLMDRSKSDFRLTSEGIAIYKFALRVQRSIGNICSIAAKEAPDTAIHIYVAECAVSPSILKVITAEFAANTNIGTDLRILGESEFRDTLIADPNAWFISTTTDCRQGDATFVLNESSMSVYCGLSGLEVDCAHCRTSSSTWIDVSWGLNEQDSMCEVRRQMNMQNSPSMTVSSFDRVRDLVVAGLGVSVLPDDLVKDELSAEKVIRISPQSQISLKTILRLPRAFVALSEIEREAVTNLQKSLSSISRKI
ncbi:LysR family transcriptional regulator [Sneathiella chungangensis]|uniref:LysR family transcriptional regulator n=1 Tax=Sneathiella chungangensis TaxID=1418234 RepID=A0A845MHK1_9PROT|nr:LysR family transcriptional regulator [Sneathiella chungangensis]